MKVKVSELKEGYKIIDDVMGLTNNPIVPKNTVVTKEIIEVLQAFLIDEVNVEKIIKETKTYKPSGNVQARKNIGLRQPFSPLAGFKKAYLKAVKEFKRQFISWQSGLPIEIGIIRQIIIPLFKKIEHNPAILLVLQNYVKNNKEYIYHHSIAVGLLSGYIGKRLNMGQAEYYQVALAGCLSDCGMAKINPQIWTKKQLTFDNMKEIQIHPVNSYKMLQNISALSHPAKIGVLQHHERLDGKDTL